MYQYRLVFRDREVTPPYVRYDNKYFKTEAQAIRAVRRFFDPNSTAPCAPAKGYPYNRTVAVLQQRMSDGNWNRIAVFGPNVLKGDK